MSQFCVKWNSLNNASNDLLSFSRDAKYYSNKIDNISKNLMLSPEVSGIIRKKLKAEASQLKTLSTNTNKMSETLVEISNLYKTTETGLLGDIDVVSFKEKANITPWDWNNTLDLVKNAGIIGAIVSVIGSITTGGISGKNGINVAKRVAGVIEKIAGAYPKSGASFDWRKLIGIDSPITSDTPKSFFGALGERIDDLKIGNAKTIAEKTKVVAKWAGLALTAIATTYDNFTDTTENNSFGRKIAESIGETTVKIAEGAAIGTAITAICAATGVAAPAVVIGGATVLVAWGVDKVCEYCTGKNFAEFVSDTVLDYGEQIIDRASGIAEAVGGAAQAAGKAISGWWNRAFAW